MIAGDPIPSSRRSSTLSVAAGLQVLQDRRILLIALLAAVGALFWPTTQSLLSEWLDAEKRVYTHGLLIVAASAYLLVRAFPRPDMLEIKGSFGAMVAATMLSAAWLVAYRAGIQVAHQALLPLLMYLGVHAIFGGLAARRAAIPILFLYSAIPIWDVGIGTLQALTVDVVGALLHIFGITAFVSGNFVHIPSGVFEVVDGCAGLHYFIVAVTIAALYGELQRDTPKIRLLLLLLAAGLALVTNWVRVFVVVVAGYLTDMQHYLVRVDHYYFGWALFAFTMAAFFLFVRRLPAAPQEQTSPPVPSDRPARNISTHTTVAFSVLALAAGPVYSLARPVEAAQHAHLSLPVGTSQWSGPSSCSDEWRPVHASADERQMGEYRSADTRVCLYIASYLLQRQGKEAVSFDNALYGAELADVEEGGVAQVGDHRVQELRGSDAHGRDSLLWSYFSIDGYATSKPVVAQLRYGLASLVSMPVTSVVVVRAACAPSCDETRTVLGDFMRTVVAPAADSSGASR